MTFPVLARVWLDGERVFENTVLLAECDDESVELHLANGDKKMFTGNEWDELTVEYDG